MPLRDEICLAGEPDTVVFEVREHAWDAAIAVIGGGLRLFRRRQRILIDGSIECSCSTLLRTYRRIVRGRLGRWRRRLRRQVGGELLWAHRSSAEKQKRAKNDDTPCPCESRLRHPASSPKSPTALTQARH